METMAAKIKAPVTLNILIATCWKLSRFTANWNRALNTSKGSGKIKSGISLATNHQKIQKVMMIVSDIGLTIFGDLITNISFI